ncbi:SHOCT-like domain-containing protein [Geosporobacter ferrireducens]|uniref:YvlB/LiaX N-terminal domain-containing protein n=1 Tax=Geosporobacter ferrireducens TaxID=1424294 RepID=A0A1D8GKI3_9FIRM|nr:hypothetical protein [Geosporobacter ferrireducens]AOT71424.1 hypothetical protein Gferi_18960 [Geosporobacter ferrireducens]MTI57728.1 hypothetical protein [Geosporobacter ferrireducens]
MDNEKLKILEMIQEGKLSSSEALELLNALQEVDNRDERLSLEKSDTKKERFLRVRVSGNNPGVKKVDVNIPLSLMKIASKFINLGMTMIPQEAKEQMEHKGIDVSKIDFDELVQAIDQGLSDGKLVDVDVDDAEQGRITVEVYVD